MKFVAVAILLLTAAVAFTGATLLTRDHGKRTVTVTVAATGDVQPYARTLAAIATPLARRPGSAAYSLTRRLPTASA
jgi:hypothetical protein